MSGAPLLRGEDVARILNVSRSTAFRLLRSGEINSVRIGRLLRTTQAEVDKYIETNMTSGDRKGVMKTFIT